MIQVHFFGSRYFRESFKNESDFGGVYIGPTNIINLTSGVH